MTKNLFPCNAMVSSTINPVKYQFLVYLVKCAHSGLRQFLATESPLKMMKNAFYFTSKTLFVLKIFKIFS